MRKSFSTMFVALLLVSMIVVAGCGGGGDSGSGVSGTCAADKVWNGAACVTLESAVAPIMLAKTGQTFCAGDLSGATISCDGIAPDYFDSIYTHYPGSAWPVVDKIFTGQDTALFSGKAWPTPRFVADKDRTVFDKVTGLVWSRNANPAGTAQNWQGALDYVKSLNSSSYMGRNDWRLPNINDKSKAKAIRQTPPFQPKRSSFILLCFDPFSVSTVGRPRLGP